MRVYLAGPEVFFLEPEIEGQRLRDLCTQNGFEGVFPLGGDLNIEGLEKWEIAEAIFDANIQKIDSCVAVIAHMTPFHGPGMDGGTDFELC